LGSAIIASAMYRAFSPRRAGRGAGLACARLCRGAATVTVGDFGEVPLAAGVFGFALPEAENSTKARIAAA